MSLILSLAVVAFTPPTLAPTKPEPWFVIDVAPAPAPIPPPPKPSAVVEIGQDELLVVEFKQKSFLMPVDAAIVKITTDAGPIKIRGKFVGGGGKVQTKSFAGPQVFVVEAAGPGQTVLTWVKVGAQTPADVLQRTVKTGVAPQPPPGPGPTPPGPTPPGPTPPDPTPSKVGPAWVIFVGQSEDRTAAQAAVLTDMSMRSELERRGHKVRLFDADDPAVKAHHYDEAAAAAGGMPAVIIQDKRGKVVDKRKLPASSIELLDWVKGATGQ